MLDLPATWGHLIITHQAVILRPTRSQPEVTIDFPSSVLDPSRRPAFVLLETVAYKAGATSRSIDEKSNAFFRNVANHNSNWVAGGYYTIFIYSYWLFISYVLIHL